MKHSAYRTKRLLISLFNNEEGGKTFSLNIGIICQIISPVAALKSYKHVLWP
jgi:hypothetical protein